MESLLLPDVFVPHSYDIALSAAPQASFFSGEVILKGRCLEPVSELQLHSKDLQLLAVRARSAQGGPLHKADVTYLPAQERVALRFAAPLAAGEWIITCRYRGKINSHLTGLYRCGAGEGLALASQCQATSARMIFPCLDEPRWRAQLGWSVTAPADLVVITNGALRRRRQLQNGEIKWYFKPTPPIPTYLAALTMGPYVPAARSQVGQVPATVWTYDKQAHLAAHAQAVTAFVIPYYEQYFATPYPYEKLCQVAVADFDAGAMENVGAIFYRRHLLLLSPEQAPLSAKQGVTEVVAHEIAHQWFGNHVSLAWWDDLWLNEAFATWMAFKVGDAFDPSLRLWDAYFSGREAALREDALLHTHAVYAPIADPADIGARFDLITYEKGCAIVRMLERFLGEEVFQQGIARYMQQHGGQAVRSADLWRALSAESGTDVEGVLGSFINQPGFPVLFCSTGSDDPAFRRLHVAQRRCLASAAHMQQTPSNPQRWQVPLVVQYGTGNGVAQQRALLTEQSATLTLPGDGPLHWLYPNPDAMGFFRVHLDAPLLRNLLQEGLPHLSPASKSALLYDQWALLILGLISPEQLFAVLSALCTDDSPLVRRTLVQTLGDVQRDLITPAAGAAFAHYVNTQLGTQLQALGWRAHSQEPAAQREGRAWLLRAVVEFGRDPQIIAQLAPLLATEQQQPAHMESELADAVVALYARCAEVSALPALLAQYQARSSGAAPHLLQRYVAALGSLTAPGSAAALLGRCLSGDIAPEHRAAVLCSHLRCGAEQAELMPLLMAQWPQLAEQLGSMGQIRIIEHFAYAPPEHEAQVRAFFAHLEPHTGAAQLKVLEMLALRRQLRSSARLPTERYLLQWAAAPS